MNIESFDYTTNLLQVILWQYDKAPNIQALLQAKQVWYNTNQSNFWQNWETDVFDLTTANLFGLAVWSIILDLPLFVPTDPDSTSKPIFGFNETLVFPALLNTYLNFENGNFFNAGGQFTLTLAQQRFLLRLRYFQLANRGDIPDINAFLNYLYTYSGTEFSGTAWVLDNFGMKMTYVFTEIPAEAIRRALLDYDLLPRPAGVGLDYLVLTGTVFGFDSLNQNFLNGNFINGFF